MKSIATLAVLSVALAAVPASAQQAAATIDAPTAGRFAALALSCVRKEYPNKISHVLTSPGDVRAPHELTPAFYGCYDWHSSVHGHWMLARLIRSFPRAPFATEAVKALRANLTPARIAGEVAYLKVTGREDFERPYGFAWLLQLAAELRETRTSDAAALSKALAPLEAAVVARLQAWLPKLAYPIRAGEHSQTAFAFGLILDYARGTNPALAAMVIAKLREFHLGDRDCPIGYEPSGQDFLSPCIAEADVMRRVLPPNEFAAWLTTFLPRLPTTSSGAWLPVGVVTDKTDGKLAHLDGLNLSRAWMLEGIAAGLPPGDARRGALLAAARTHAASGLAAVTGEHYAGGHWLGSFATYLTTRRGIDTTVQPHAPSGPAAARPSPSQSSSSDYLYLWASPADSAGPDFLAVYDVRDRTSADRYGALVTTLPVPGRGNRAHHTEHVMAADGNLFANGFNSGQSFIFDLSTPSAPRLAKQLGDVGALMHPHSFWRLPNGHVLTTFQMQHDSLGVAPGGLVELTTRGEVVRSASANLVGVDRRIRPYSAAILPGFDRVVVTTSDMDNRDTTQALQLWRLSDLSLQHTIQLPRGPRGDEGYRSAEPRILSDGKTVLVSTFNCGLYLLNEVASATPSARLVASFPRKAGTSCAVPIVAGNYYLITVPAWSAVVSLDVSDPTQPREVSRITLGRDDVPHWIGIEPNHQRVVITGYQAMKTRVLIARFDETSGKLVLDERFRAAGSAEPGLRMEGITWPHGGSGPAVPHGAVFSAASAPRSRDQRRTAAQMQLEHNYNNNKPPTKQRQDAQD